MNGLSTHDGSARSVSYEYLQAMPKPTPMGARHFPYPFHNFVDDVREALDKYGFSIESEQFALAKHADAKLFGVMQLKSDRSDYAPLLGLRGAHDQSFGRSIAIGSKVFVCSNLAFYGEQVLSTKQTTHIAERIPRLLSNVIQKLPDWIEDQDTFIENLRSTPLNEAEASEIFVQSLRDNILKPTILPKAVALWDAHEGDRTAWDLFNDCTHVLKPKATTAGALDALKNRTLRLTTLLEGVAL